MTEIIPTDTPSNQNYLSPNKYKIVIGRFPNIEFFASSAPVPGYTTGSVYIPTEAPNDYYEIGDKVNYNDLIIQFNIDVNLNTIKEIYNWSNMASVKSRKNFNPFSDMTIMTLTNNNNANVLFKVHNCFPYLVEDIELSSALSEDSTPKMNAHFKYSHFTIG